jgi:hypothetical protein
VVTKALMRLRAGNHKASAAAKVLTIAVMAAATFAQLLSMSHEMTVRHFRCSEHGELTHVAPVVASPAALSTPRANDALRAQDSDAADAHEHCGVAFTIEGRSGSPPPASAANVASPPPPLHPAATVLIPAGRAGVLASAPKTSPPSA